MYLSCSVIQENVIFDHGEDQFSLEVLTPDEWCHPRHWNLRKVNYVLPPYLFDHMSCPTAVKYIYWTRCFKFTMFPCIPTREYVWRHRRVVINRVVPWEADRPIHNNQPSGRPLRSHDGSWDEQTVQATSETGRVPIPIILTFYLASEGFRHICSLLPCCPSPLKSREEIFFKGGRVVTPHVMVLLITY
jgi:hypothetical protein